MTDGEHTRPGPLFVPVRASQPGLICLRTGRLASGLPIGLAFTSEAALLSTLGPRQQWTLICEQALLEMLAPLGIDRVRIDPRLARDVASGAPEGTGREAARPGGPAPRPAQAGTPRSSRSPGRVSAGSSTSLASGQRGSGQRASGQRASGQRARRHRHSKHHARPAARRYSSPGKSPSGLTSTVALPASGCAAATWMAVSRSAHSSSQNSSMYFIVPPSSRGARRNDERERPPWTADARHPPAARPAHVTQ
jgi:hypothetical protein